jgi:16S rRNA (uracil1498-N3)-methyltransferase
MAGRVGGEGVLDREVMMPRFYVPCPKIEKGKLRVEGQEVKHIRNVLRLKRGDAITVFDSSGKEYKGPIVGESSSSVIMAIEEILPSKAESPLEITLAQSLLKGEKMDYLIQKATELGVKEIAPFVSSRSIPLLEGSKRAARLRRWTRIAIEASKQCGRGVVPIIRPIQEFPGLLRLVPEDSLRLILWEREEGRLRQVLADFKETKKVFFVVGPEGGLNPEEIERAKKAGFLPVSLGERILRSETGSLSFLTILQYAWGDMG